MSSYAHERLKRAKAQLESAKRNFAEWDVETASNRAFLAAENAAAAAIVKAGGHVPRSTVESDLSLRISATEESSLTDSEEY